MRLPGLSIRGLIGFVLVTAIGLAALRFSTPIVAGCTIMATLFGLGLAVLAAVNRREARRAFWIGFAVMGLGYVLFSGPAWTLTRAEIEHRSALGGEWDSPHQEPILAHWLPTTALLDAICPSVQVRSGSTTPLRHVASFLGFTNPRTRPILAAIDRPLDMRFPNETPLQEVVAYIKASTRSSLLPEGIPFYMDPIGFQEAEKTMASPVSLDLNGITLRTSLALLLQQLDMGFAVTDEMVTITSGNKHIAFNSEAAQSFLRVGHCLFALVFALIGGLAGRALYATRPG